jgi:hypothetical protein
MGLITLLPVEAKNMLIFILPSEEEIRQDLRCNLTEGDPVPPKAQRKVRAGKRRVATDVTQTIFGAAKRSSPRECRFKLNPRKGMSPASLDQSLL